MTHSEATATKFELVEGATFTLSDGTDVTVRDNELELSDGRRLPMPAAGETITVEKTVHKPDGSTVRVKHTIRLSETLPESVPGTGDGGEGELKGEQANGDDDHGKEGKDDEGKGEPNAGEIHALPEAPSKEPEKSRAEQKPMIMGLSNSGKRSLRAMLWGSIPEGDDVVTYTPPNSMDVVEDPKTSEPKSLLHPQHSIKEEDEHGHDDDDEDGSESADASENANESFEFEGKTSSPKSGEKATSPKDAAEAVAEAADTAGKVTVLAFRLPAEKPTEHPGNPSKAGQSPYSSLSKDNTTQTSVDYPTEDGDKADPNNHGKPVLARQGHIPSATDLVKDAAKAAGSPVRITFIDNAPDAEAPQDNVKTSPTSDGKSPAPGAGPSNASRPSSESRPNETGDELRLKLTPILRSLESKPQTNNSDPAQREPRAVPSEDRKGTVPPNTPAVTEEPVAASEGEIISVPKVVSYYEAITPSKQPWSKEDAAPRIREPSPVGKPTTATKQESQPTPTQTPTQTPTPDKEKFIVPKIVNFAVPMRPQKVYVSSQEPEEMENTPIPARQAPTPPTAKPPVQEPVVEKVCKPQVVDQMHTVRLIPVQATQPPAEPKPQPEAPKSNDVPDREAKPTKEYNVKMFEPEPKRSLPLETKPQPDAPKTTNDQPDREAKPKPREYDPALFEPDPKRPLLLTSEATETAPPYEPGVHDSRTLPIDRKTVVTEQPPPFGEEERRHDPHDPFLPDNPVPGTGRKQDGWLGVCMDFCCCCWAP